jgi:uncharacterized protein YbaR (Trm112 family)
VDAKLLELLVCPVTKGPLIYDRERQELISKTARLAYPVRDGIPVMLEEMRAITRLPRTSDTRHGAEVTRAARRVLRRPAL